MDITQDTFTDWFKEGEKELEALFFEFLRFESISADATYREKLQDCATWLQKHLSDAGFLVSRYKDDTAPILLAHYDKAGPDKPTLLIYNHYDVQPVDPIKLWTNPPFAPYRKDNEIFARGAQDNKGQCFYVIAALITMLKKTGSLPINVKLCIEGQEETGSELLSELLQEKKQEFASDYLLVCDLGMKGANTPAITLGIRGIVAWTVEVTGSKSDLHSGAHGGLVYNPLHALVEILASLRDASGHIQIPGFYDDVVMPTDDERKEFSFDFDEKTYFEEIGCMATGGEKAFLPLERAWIRPTLEINGVTGGYGGAGTKTVIPSYAQAKLTSRICPNQDPQKIAHLVKEYIEKKAPDGITVRCHIHEGFGLPLRTSARSHIVQVLKKSIEAVYHCPCDFMLEGATIPIAADLQKAAGAETALFGLGLTTDNIHAPNEHFGWDRIEKGFCIILDVLQKLGST